MENNKENLIDMVLEEFDKKFCLDKNGNTCDGECVDEIYGECDIYKKKQFLKQTLQKTEEYVYEKLKNNSVKDFLDGLRKRGMIKYWENVHGNNDEYIIKFNINK